MGQPFTAPYGWGMDLDDLPWDDPALARLYRDGRMPPWLEGPLPGRLLTPWAPERVVRALPWLGKSFYDRVGYNRLRGLGERVPFHVLPGLSRLDHEPCLILDYDLPGNLPGIRRVMDELREVADGLMLGPGLLRVGDRARLFTWFALRQGRRAH